MKLLDDLTAIDCENHSRSANENCARIAELLATYGFNVDGEVPPWFRKLIGMIVGRKTGTFLFDDVGSDVGSIFLELSSLFGWNIVDTGEEVDLVFPVSKIAVHISREARSIDGKSCCSANIRSLQ